MIDLQGKSAVVTGATRGIGRAIAEALAAAGSNVIIAARNERDCREAADAITGKGKGKAVGIAADVRLNEDCERIINSAVSEFGGLSILINNAGIGGFSAVEQMEVAHWDRVIGTNLNSLFYCTHAALPHLKKEGGWVINIGSLAGKNAFPGGAAYNASKFGLIGFTEALMQEVRQDDVRVSYIMPGSVATDFDGSSPQSAGWMIQPEDIAQIVLDLFAMPARTLPSRVEVRPAKPLK